MKILLGKFSRFKTPMKYKLKIYFMFLEYFLYFFQECFHIRGQIFEIVAVKMKYVLFIFATLLFLKESSGIYGGCMSYYTQPSDKPGHVKASYFIIFYLCFHFQMMILEQKDSERNKRMYSLLFKVYD